MGDGSHRSMGLRPMEFFKLVLETIGACTLLFGVGYCFSAWIDRGQARALARKEQAEEIEKLTRTISILRDALAQHSTRLTTLEKMKVEKQAETFPSSPNRTGTVTPNYGNSVCTNGTVYVGGTLTSELPGNWKQATVGGKEQP
jgi:hypothetical protein